MKLSIIIVNYNTKDFLKDCIDSIITNQPSFPYEIIVVDNNSIDGSREIIGGYSNVKAIFNEENIGFARANNIGIRIAKGEYILLLNSDTLVLKDSLDNMIEYMERNSNIGILGPELINRERKIIQPSWEFKPSILGESLKKTLSPKSLRKLPFLKYVVQFLQRKTKKVPVVTGASMLVRKKVFEGVGLFDESFFLYFEDSDFCNRVRKFNKWEIIFYPKAKIIHLLGKSMEKIEGETQKRYRRSQVCYYSKHLSKIQQYLLKLYLNLTGKDIFLK